MNFQEFTNRWFTPTTLLAVVGGVVWGIQLNYLALENAKDIAHLHIEVERHEHVNDDHAQRCATMGTLVQQIQEDIREIKTWQRYHNYSSGRHQVGGSGKFRPPPTLIEDEFYDPADSP